MIETSYYVKRDVNQYFGQHHTSKRNALLATFLCKEVSPERIDEWKAIFKGEAPLVYSMNADLEVILEFNEDNELEWNDGKLSIVIADDIFYDYPIPFLEKILDTWVAIIKENHSFIEFNIDWEKEVCTARGLELWINPNKKREMR